MLFVIHYPVFGGPHNQALRLAPKLRERGWETIVLLPDESGNAAARLRASGVEVIELPLGRLRAKADPRLQVRFAAGLRADVRAIRRVVRERRIDLIGIGGLVNPQAAVAGRREQVPVVWQILDTLAPMALRRLLMPVVARLADTVMTTGMHVAREHPGALELGERLVPFFPPVDADVFRPDEERRAQARAELGLRPGDLVVGNVGNLTPMKGHLTFIRAAALLRPGREELRFVILGAGYEYRTEYVRSLTSEAERLGLRIGRDLLIADPGARVADLAPAFDVYWLSSEGRSEGIPTAVGEAMALGLPVVATRVGGVAEAVEAGRTGFLVPPRRADALAEATRPLLDDEQLRRELGERGRVRAIDLFGLERCVDDHLRAFELALAHRAGR